MQSDMPQLKSHSKFVHRPGLLCLLHGHSSGSQKLLSFYGLGKTGARKEERSTFSYCRQMNLQINLFLTP